MVVTAADYERDIGAKDRTIANLQRELSAARQLLAEAVDDIDDWASYASDYFREKHDLAGALARYRAALAEKGEERG
jgi:hypothetical protein